MKKFALFRIVRLKLCLFSWYGIAFVHSFSETNSCLGQTCVQWRNQICLDSQRSRFMTKIYQTPEENTISNNDSKSLQDEEQKKSLFIFGLGYVGSALAFKLLKDGGWEVSGTTTDSVHAERLREQGINAFVFDKWSIPNIQDNEKRPLVEASHILCSVPPSSLSGKDPVLLAHSSAMSMAVNENKKCQWVGYLSSTGVYGDRDGQWVTEDERAQPITPKTRARRDAERAWQFLQERKGIPLHIFRLAGIYGPGRSALDTLRKAGGDMSKCNPNDEFFISRVHVSDIIQLLENSMLNPTPGLILNVADNQPSTRYEVLSYACRLLDVPVSRPASSTPAFDRWLEKGSQGLGARSGGSKRVDNGQMKRLLAQWGTELVHPDYRSGLEALAEGDTSPFTKDQFELVSKRNSPGVQVSSQVIDPSGTTRNADSPGVDSEAVLNFETTSFATKQELVLLEQKVANLSNQVELISEKLEIILNTMRQRQ